MFFLHSKLINGGRWLYPVSGQRFADGENVDSTVVVEPAETTMPVWNDYPAGTVFATYSLTPRFVTGFVAAYRVDPNFPSLFPLLPVDRSYVNRNDIPTMIVKHEWARHLLQTRTDAGFDIVRKSDNRTVVTVDGYPIFIITKNSVGFMAQPGTDDGDVIVETSLEKCLEKLGPVLSSYRSQP